jgi:DNA-binding NarL/FixJ family response regulator
MQRAETQKIKALTAAEAERQLLAMRPSTRRKFLRLHYALGGNKTVVVMERPLGPAAEILTRRQRQVVRLLASGSSNKQAGAEIGISARTVESHRLRVMRKLGLENFSQLVLFAARERMVQL